MSAASDAPSEVPAVGLAVLDRSQIELLGKDRARLLHGLCTNDIKRLAPGDGCEAFLTNAQGHTIGYVDVFCRPDSLVIDSAAGEAPAIIQNLDRYIVREDVRFLDRSREWNELLVSGVVAAERLLRVLSSPLPERALNHSEIVFRDQTISVRRTTMTAADCFQLSAPAGALAAVRTELQQAGAVVLEPDMVEGLRIEAGTPIFGRDITAENLPQEVDRDSLTISFDKGCYLGQETVARIDSLGHVNRLLRGLRFSGRELPPAGGQILRDGKVIARLTSVGWSPRLNSPLAFAYVKRNHHQPGTVLPSEWGDAEVIRLPLPKDHD